MSCPWADAGVIKPVSIAMAQGFLSNFQDAGGNGKPHVAGA